MIGPFVQIDIGARFSAAAAGPPGTAGIQVSVDDSDFHNIRRFFAGVGNRAGRYKGGNGRGVV